MQLAYGVQRQNGQVLVTFSGFPESISAASISTEVLQGEALLLQVLSDDGTSSILSEVTVPLGAAVDPDSCTVKLKRKQGSLTFTADVVATDGPQPQVAAEPCHAAEAVHERPHGTSDEQRASSSSIPDARHQRDESTPEPGGAGPSPLGIAPPIDCRYLGVAMSMDLASIYRTVRMCEGARASC